ncbi:MAG TPA: hypothetical protein IAC34_02275 [Candidatus Coprenecus stercoripullorum]|nr:hypothetical protein [Candidatus Coprenecus stercoripullorum]
MRGFGSDLLAATLNAGRNIASGYITSFIDLGVNAIASLATRNSRLKKEWLETVEKENEWSMSLATVDEIKDFYCATSTEGALDPAGMKFDGIGCLRMDGQDTVFFISCHIDRTKLYRIINHSKFELILDTLIIDPLRSNLPNTSLPIDFSFDQRKDFRLKIDIGLFSSWYTELIELHTNEQLGRFTIDIPVRQSDLDSEGRLCYFRKEGENSKYKISGESFIVPRSYTGYRDRTGRYRRIWGTGQYKLTIDLNESCDITDAYRDGWKRDYKLRRSLQPKNEFLTTVWQTISSQKWDEIGQKWIITTLSAPAGVISDELIERMNLSTEGQQE